MLKAAVIGMGWWGKHIIRRTKGSRFIKLVLAVDQNRAMEGFAKEHDLAFASRLEDALASKEVEAVLKGLDDVYDVVVVGVADDRWGERVAAVVQLADGAEIGADGLTAHVRDHLAGYKVPKDVVFVDRVQRSPAGKADYRWAKATATAGADASA